MKKIKIAAVQFDITLKEPEKNNKKAFSFIEKAAKEGSKIILLPELWTTGYSLEEFPKLAETDDGPTLKKVKELCTKFNVTVVGSIAERDNNDFYNTAYVINKDGIQGKYRKIHLVPFMREPLFLKPGNELPIFNCEGLKLGVTICYDLRFPELIALLGYQKIDLYLNPSEFPRPRLDHWRTLLKARAIENQFFAAASTRIGKDDYYSFFGHAIIVDPLGNILAEASETEEEIITADLDLTLLDEARESLPLLENRCPEVYAGLRKKLL